MANLAFGILGILCIWLRGDFWTATGIGQAVFLIGCAYGHFQDLLAGNLAPYSAGAGIWLYDVVVPLIILGLLWARRRLTRSPRPEYNASGDRFSPTRLLPAGPGDLFNCLCLFPLWQSASLAPGLGGTG